MKTLPLALVLLWFALTGGYAGWQNPTLTLVNVIAFTGLMAWLMLSVQKLNYSPVDTGFFFFLTAMMVSTIVTGTSETGVIKISVWFAYLAFYHLAQRWPDETIHRAALWALIPYALFSFFPWENPNVVAFNLLGLALLAMPSWNLKIYSPVILVIGGLLNCVAGVLSALVAATRYVARPGLLCLGLLALIPVGWWVNPAGYAWRLQFWADAWRGFWSAPFFGLGPGQYFTLNDWPHAHNIVATTAAEGGLIGLAALAWLVWAVARRWPQLPVWATALVAAYGAWSLVDEPLHFWGAGFIFFIALSRGKESNHGLEVSKTQLEV